MTSGNFPREIFARIFPHTFFEKKFIQSPFEKPHPEWGIGSRAWREFSRCDREVWFSATLPSGDDPSMARTKNDPQHGVHNTDVEGGRGTIDSRPRNFSRFLITTLSQYESPALLRLRTWHPQHGNMGRSSPPPPPHYNHDRRTLFSVK